MNTSPVRFGALYRIEFNPVNRDGEKLPPESRVGKELSMSLATRFANEVVRQWSEKNGHLWVGAFIKADQSPGSKNYEAYLAADEPGKGNDTWSQFVLAAFKGSESAKQVISTEAAHVKRTISAKQRVPIEAVKLMYAESGDKFVKQFVDAHKTPGQKTIQVSYATAGPNASFKSWKILKAGK